MVKYTLTNLTDKSVSVLKQNFNDDGVQIGRNWRRAYANSEEGRQKVEAEVPSPQKEAIFQVWGSEPKVFPGEEYI